MKAAESDREFPWWWTAYFFLVPFGMPVSMGLVIGDLPAFGLLFLTLAKALSGNPITSGKAEAWFVLFIGCSLLGIEVTGVPDFYLRELLAVLFLFACFKVTADFLNNRDRFERATAITGYAVISLLVINTLAVLSHNNLTYELTKSFLPDDKLSWPFEFSGQLGISLAVLYPICICIRNWSSPHRLIMHLMLIVNAGAIGSRSVFWLCLCEIFYVEAFIFSTKSAVINVFKIIALLFSIGTVITFFGESFSFQRSLGQIKEIPLLFDEPRMMILRKALRTVPTWFQGYGLGCFKAFHGIEIHNTPLSILVETGFIGLVSAACFIGSILLAFWRSRTSQNALIKHGLALSVFAILCNSMFRNLVSSRACWFVLALCYCFRHFQKDGAIDVPANLGIPPKAF
ncbi:MAG: hypothetical protein ACD_39C02090G0004 [uncultured bacterium]|nr:MAG: hypothetical protein ACD_39C02090G0004 [uncultured bacterium]